MRTSSDHYDNGRLIDGYDYKNQAWVTGGVYAQCGHRTPLAHCYACHNHGQPTKEQQ
jgi:hypothetical protein